MSSCPRSCPRCPAGWASARCPASPTGPWASRTSNGASSSLRLRRVSFDRTGRASAVYVTTERSLGSTPFLPPDAFLGGPFIPKSGQTNTGGRATYRGYIVFTNLDRELVRQIVPPTLELAENRVSPGVHPIMYIYGFPEDTSWIIDGETYLEGTKDRKSTRLNSSH